MLRANAEPRLLHDTADWGLIFKQLPAGPARLVFFSDAAKGDTDKSENPIAGFFMFLLPLNADSYDGPCHLIDFMGKKAPRKAKSSMHGEAIGFCQATERSEKIARLLEEFYQPYQSTVELLRRQEYGEYHTPVEGVLDAKSLYDVLVSTKDPTPTDEGSRLWLNWARERLHARSLDAVAWASTTDMLADCTTKAGVDVTLVKQAMEGRITLGFSMLRNGRILDARKGLPPPKSQRDAVAAAFCQRFHASHAAWLDFTRAVHSDDTEGVHMLLRRREVEESTEELEEDKDPNTWFESW